MLLKQKIERVRPAEFIAETTLIDAEENAMVMNRTFERCNSIFAAYKSLILALRNVSDCDVELDSNHHQLKRELFGEKDENTTLSNMLADVLAKNNINLIKKD
ncbi:hypothetical protein [Bacillus gobiensis]|uniref:Uncharacterized protein n=1 Tax=Bacillus gobiensis TaxID=1441095 RepID=A0A0M4FGD0_9BACI|nr:hypothetical protein [Bacillus gobiensis]ALC81549.1 hypothetical protein AM592_08015 [Bacillus gobiensis]